MASYRFMLFIEISFILVLGMSLSSIAANDDRKAYIVYMGSLPDGKYLPSSNHHNILQQVIKGSSVADILIRSYKRSFNGFAAKLTDGEAKKLASMKEVVSVFPNRILHLHTTRSWDFMGFNNIVRRNPTIESNVIIGVIDTGIWPESPSFSDEGFGPVPKKWKGACRGGKNFTCNNKIIGARFYQTNGIGSARDEMGHGSHTASIAAGNEVNDVSFFGLAQGTARGGVPSARIAAYKVCDSDGCASAVVLAAFDDAIADGVDILTVSLGSIEQEELFNDVIAIGSFHAMAKGILTLNSAGNNGDKGEFMVTSVSPWVLGVAASTTDRKFIDKVVLGNGQSLTGFSVNSFSPSGSGTKLPIVYGIDVSRNCSEIEAGLCSESCLDSHLVNGKITLCDQLPGIFEAYNASSAGAILLNNDYNDNISYVMALPAVALNNKSYTTVKLYVNSTKHPVAEILKSETIKDVYSPVVAEFSSLGPNFVIPDILKPDITAPGVDILAAYSPIASPSGMPGDNRQVKYNVVSGTSMSCPHAAAVAAYVKTYHPAWSPSAIQSAIMTTAWPMDKSKNPNGEISYGSGHINPVKAIDPGLVYEAFKEDYIKLMCSIGYSSDNIKKVSGDHNSNSSTTCPKSSENVPPRDLNYPSMTVAVGVKKSFEVSFRRTVKNVGFANSTYKAQVSPNPELKVEVVPNVLSFKEVEEKKSFNVTVSGGALDNLSRLSTTLIWSDGRHIVRSPILVHAYMVMES